MNNEKDFHLHMSEELFTKVAARAKDRTMPVSSYIRQLIMDDLAAHEASTGAKNNRAVSTPLYHRQKAEVLRQWWEAKGLRSPPPKDFNMKAYDKGFSKYGEDWRRHPNFDFASQKYLQILMGCDDRRAEELLPPSVVAELRAEGMHPLQIADEVYCRINGV